MGNLTGALAFAFYEDTMTPERCAAWAFDKGFLYSAVDLFSCYVGNDISQ
jgi:hypothetical protein